MNLHGNTILITGGGSGIGLALATHLVGHHNTVIICGRTEAKLAAAQRAIPGLHIKCCDVTVQQEREELIAWTLNHFPSLNMVVNNAAISQELDMTGAAFDFDGIEQELRTNLHAPIELALRFLPHLLRQKEAALVNISSGLVYSPAATAPIYSAAKAGLHTFTQTLRYQVRDKALRVFEVLPPAVDTPLNATVKVDKISVEEAATAILAGLAKNREEIRIGQVKFLYFATRLAPNFINRKINEVIARASTPV